MNTAATAAEVTPNIAEPFAGGFYAGRIRVGDQVYALVAAPRAEGERDEIRWNSDTKSVEGARSFFDGRANTEAMAQAGSELAKWAQGLSIGGFTDWYIPSRDELELLYRAFKPTNDENYCWRGDNPSSVPVGYAYSRDSPAQTAVEEFREDGAEAFAPKWHWTSTQYAGLADFAWVQSFEYGVQYSDALKSSGYRARVVRRVAI